MKNFNQEKKIIIIGGGASGMMAGVTAGQVGAEVIILEKMPQLGSKLLISGKTRCNISNSAPMEKFLLSYGENGKWLRNSFGKFFSDDLVALLASCGVATKVERGGRIFPTSDKSSDIIDAIKQLLNKNSVAIITSTVAKKIIVKDGRAIGVETNKGNMFADAVILATGGVSFPQTGSSGDGYLMAKATRHSVVELTPSLIPLIVKEQKIVQSMQGVSLKNVRLSAFACQSNDIDDTLIKPLETGMGTGRKAKHPLIESRFGEMLFTHFGIGGPIVLLASQSIIRALKKASVSVAIDLKPALSREMLAVRLQKDFDASGKKFYKNILSGLLPAKMVEPIALLTEINLEKRGNAISAQERTRIVSTLKSLRLNIVTSLPINHAIVTSGGVSLNEVNPHTMESKINKGLFFCGEVLDIDANTGGYNLQAAFSTGFVAGINAGGMRE
ncbi:MAG: NAD(P)/FAD-dependent oxidoreductase [Deltaproteobacteria bacterium]